MSCLIQLMIDLNCMLSVGCMCRSRPLYRVGSVLLSVVVQALLVDILCAGNHSFSLQVISMMAIRGRSRLLRAGLHTRTRLRYKLSMKVVTSRVW
jgi:hypothetical protein